MSEIDDGGAAFPRDDFHRGIPGMSLRDWFAGQALANPNICRRDDEYPQRTAYCFADAMIATMIAERTAVAEKKAPDPAPAPMFWPRDFTGKQERYKP